MPVQTHPKITAQHLKRKAIVYLRQSSEHQVHQNLESQRLQYALVDRARALGFEDIEIIDTDLGASASVGAASRSGFEQLIASVALAEVGLVLSREASRLSRTDRDWCRLLEVCQLFGTLIADAEQVYDLNVLDDQLVLGIKGTLSVVELKVLQLRLQQGVEEKARRGELYRVIPSGYVRDGHGGVVKDPNQRVQDAMALVFKKFRELRSIRQTFLWFHHNGVELPVNKSQGARMRLVWQLPTDAFLGYVLQNPFYAGVYVYGRRPTQTVLEAGQLKKRPGPRRQAHECEVFIRDHHEGYIDWERFEEHLRIMDDNRLKLGDGGPSTGPARTGQGLLVGLLRCGRCGRKLYVRYWGKSGTNARYFCKGDFESGGHHCIAFSGYSVDRRFSQELLAVISPLGMRASLQAMEQFNAQQDDQRHALRRQLQQVDYEVERAFEQYNEVDPRNRLVATELEQRWNVKLEERERLQTALQERAQSDRPLSEEERENILALGEQFALVWESAHCPIELKKRILRSVVEEVIADIDETRNQLRFVIHWKGGTHTQYELPKPVSAAGRQTALEDLEVIRRMAVRYGDDEIARVLNKLGRLTATGKRWSEQRVATVRRKYAIAGQRRSTPDPEILTMRGAAVYSGVSSKTIKRLVASGVLNKEQVVPWAPWEIKRADLDAESVQGILERLRETGRLGIGDDPANQQALF
jgi:DNA invertase Pin-like site-specific DNA recombinase